MAEMDMLKLEEKEQNKNAAMQTPQGVGRRMQRQQLSKSLKPVESLEPQKVGTMRAQQPSIKPTSALKMGTVDVTREPQPANIGAPETTTAPRAPAGGAHAAMADIAKQVEETGSAMDKQWQGASRRYADAGQALSYEQARQVLLEHALTSPDRKYATGSIIKHLGQRDKTMELAKQILEGFRKDELGKEIRSGAEEFRENIDDIASEQGGILRRQAEDMVESGTKDIRKGFSSRGLLYSGLRQGAESGLKGQVAGELARSQAQLRSDLEDEARAKEFMAARYGLQGYEEARQRYEQVYNQRLRNALERRKRFSQIGSGLGYAIGAGVGSMGSSPEVAPMETGDEIFNTTQGNLPDMGGIA